MRGVVCVGLTADEDPDLRALAKRSVIERLQLRALLSPVEVHVLIQVSKREGFERLNAVVRPLIFLLVSMANAQTEVSKALGEDQIPNCFSL
jgi:hypothetical protein